MENQQQWERLVPRRPFLPAFMLLLLDEASSHGYELCERLKGLGFVLADPSPVYRELRALERSGLVRSVLAPHETGPVPKVYELTPEGHRALGYCAREAVAVAGLLEEFGRRYQSRRGPRR